MKNDPRIERYLTTLEQVLRPFPVGDRAEIVTEIKSHIMSALERDPATQIDSVLAALGEPEIVANRYLIERGMKPTKPPISPIVKWLVIGVLGSFAMLLVFLAVIIIHFNPLIQVDDRKEHVSLLGGMIEVNGKSGEVHIDGKTWGEKDNENKGSFDLGTAKTINVKFKNARFELGNSADQKLAWNCTHLKKFEDMKSNLTEEAFNLDISDTEGAHCTLQIPEGLKVNVSGSNGKVNVEKAHFHLNLNLVNGKVGINPDSDKLYRYALSALNGKVASFSSSDKPEAYTISVRLSNGKISQEE